MDNKTRDKYADIIEDATEIVYKYFARDGEIPKEDVPFAVEAFKIMLEMLLKK